MSLFHPTIGSIANPLLQLATPEPDHDTTGENSIPQGTIRRETIITTLQPFTAIYFSSGSSGLQ